MYNNEPSSTEVPNFDFPLEHIQKSYGSQCKEFDFYWTPICLSGPRTLEELKEVIDALMPNDRFGGIYLQTRVADSDIIALGLDHRIAHMGFRTVYNLDTTIEMEQWLKNMKRDSRSRFKKIFKLIETSELKIAKYNTNEPVSDAIIHSCFSIYCKTAEQRNFNPIYRFQFKAFKNLCLSQSWLLTTVSLKDDIIGFSLMGDTELDFDYTFAATVHSQYDVARVLILSAFETGKDFGKNVCLGGGIKEHDQLATFKDRLGTTSVAFANLKLIGPNLLYLIGSHKFQQFKNARWPDV